MNQAGRPLTHSPNAHQALTFPNIYTIASGKGGVGKTWCSITLSSLLAKAGKKVLLFDGDIGLANIDIQLGLNPKYDLCDLLAQKCDLEQVITHFSDQGDMGQKVAFDILPGRSGSGILANLSPQQHQMIFHSFKTVSQNYDFVLIDLGAGIDHSIRNIGRVALHQLLVVTTEPTSLTDAYAYIKVMHQMNPGFQFQILVNRAPSEQVGQQTFATLSKVCETYLQLQVQLAGILEEDSHISKAIRQQRAMVSVFPNSKSIQQLDKICKTSFKN